MTRKAERSVMAEGIAIAISVFAQAKLAVVAQ